MLNATPPSELMRLPVPAPADGETESAVEAVRGALMAVGRNRPVRAYAALAGTVPSGGEEHAA